MTSRTLLARAPLAAFLLATPSFAHEGHGAVEHSGTTLHLLEPVHLPFVLLAVCVVALAVRSARSVRVVRTVTARPEPGAATRARRTERPTAR